MNRKQRKARSNCTSEDELELTSVEWYLHPALVSLFSKSLTPTSCSRSCVTEWVITELSVRAAQESGKQTMENLKELKKLRA